MMLPVCLYRDRLVDYLDEPYPELYQNAVLAGRLSALDGLAVAAAQGRNLSGAPGLPSGLMQYPPYIAAAAWEAQVGLHNLQPSCMHPSGLVAWISARALVKDIPRWIPQAELECAWCHTMRSGRTAKVLANCKLKY